MRITSQVPTINPPTRDGRAETRASIGPLIQVSTESLPVRPTKPEPFTEAEREQMRRANRIRHRKIRKMFNWSTSDYEAAVKFGFPRAEGQTMPTAEYLWLKTTIAEWKDELLGDAAHDLDRCANPSQLDGSRPETPSALDAAIWPLPGEERP